MMRMNSTDQWIGTVSRSGRLAHNCCIPLWGHDVGYVDVSNFQSYSSLNYRGVICGGSSVKWVSVRRSEPGQPCMIIWTDSESNRVRKMGRMAVVTLIMFNWQRLEILRVERPRESDRLTFKVDVLFPLSAMSEGISSGRYHNLTFIFSYLCPL